jgi:hypothetical protein
MNLLLLKVVMAGLMILPADETVVAGVSGWILESSAE